MNSNSGGYNAYFLKTNLNALQKARMPQYSSVKSVSDLQNAEEDGLKTIKSSENTNIKTTGRTNNDNFTNLLNEVHN